MEDKKLSILDIKYNGILNKPVYTTHEFTWYDEFMIDLQSKWDNITGFIRGVFIGIKNIIVYAPIIYKTREWDYAYLLDLIEFKIKQMKKDMVEGKVIVDYQETSQTMANTLENIYKYQNSIEVYEDEHQEELKAIINEKDPDKLEQLTRDFFIGSYNFENECWNKIWDSIKEDGQRWWT